MQTYHAGPGVYARVPASGDGSAVEEHTATTPAHDVGVVALLVAIERLIEDHADELDTLNVFPVPDADTGRNVLATVRSARAAAEQAAPGDRRGQAVTGALRGARGNAGVLTSQLLRALFEDGGGDWAERLGTADQLCRGAVAHPVEGSFLTAVGDAATASSAVGAGEQLAVAVAAAHAAVRDSPTRLEVLARAGVVDSGARAAALVLEAVAAHLRGESPAPPAVEVPEDGPAVGACDVGSEQFEVMYLLDAATEGDLDAVRDELTRVGGSVVVVAADRLVSVHVHTDDVGAALDVGVAHGRPHTIRVEDLHQGARDAAARTGAAAGDHVAAPGVGLVVVADGEGIAQVAAAIGATTVRLGDEGPSASELRAAIQRTGRDRVLVLPAARDVPDLARGAADDGTGPDLAVAHAVDGPARLLAALTVMDPSAPDLAVIEAAAARVREGTVVGDGGGWTSVVDGAVGRHHEDVVGALAALLDRLHVEEEPELVSLLLGREVGVALRDAAAAVVARRWPDAEVDVVDTGLRHATFAVGVE